MRLEKISESLDAHMPERCNSKFGDCGPEVLQVVKRAFESGFNKFIVVDGMVYLNGVPNAIPHTWIEVNGEVKDPTASQFSGAKVEYSPLDEYRDENSPEDYLDDYEFQYGEIPSKQL